MTKVKHGEVIFVDFPNTVNSGVGFALLVRLITTPMACLRVKNCGAVVSGPRCVPGVNRMTEVTISEQMTRMTRRAIAIPFQFLCGGLLPTSSCTNRGRETWSERAKAEKYCKQSERSPYERTAGRRLCRMLNKGNHRLCK